MGQFDSLCMNCFSFENVHGKCSKCGFEESSERNAKALPIRTLLNNRYLIGNIKAVNNAVIKYYAFDAHSETKVCVTEYFPDKYCIRDGQLAQPALGFEQAFNPNRFAKSVSSLKSFNNLPAFIPILNTFAQNRTYYVVTPEYEGVTLRQAVKDNGAYKWHDFKTMIFPVLATVSALNSNGILHLGISPDDLILCEDNKLRIDDVYLNSFRCTNAENIPFISSDGFTSLEQYKGEQLGSYSDAYALSALIFFALSGTPPTKATSRVSNSTLTISSKTAQNITKDVIQVLSKGLSVQAQNRISSVEALTIELFPKDKDEQADQPKVSKPKGEQNPKNTLIIGAAVLSATILIVLILLIVLLAKGNNSNLNVVSSPTNQVSSSLINSSPSSYILNGHAVADYIGKPYSEVYQNSGNYIYFTTKISVQHRDDVARGIVIDQEPAGGTILEDGAVIELTLSLGPETVTIGDYKGWTLSKTVIDLLGKGFTNDNIRYEYKTDVTIDGGKVIGTNIPANDKASIYKEIVVYINDFKYSAITPSQLTQSGTGSQVSAPQTTVTSRPSTLE